MWTVVGWAQAHKLRTKLGCLYFGLSDLFHPTIHGIHLEPLIWKKSMSSILFDDSASSSIIIMITIIMSWKWLNDVARKHVLNNVPFRIEFIWKGCIFINFISIQSILQRSEQVVIKWRKVISTFCGLYTTL